ncbi:K02A2.6-like [Cordylochernes scorpioides]|uniref:K02A2.6-like n=1 Tax=Cordylochernes scorpioides TaxID=51811 RepID=A0ABY6KFJ9_9ARAC|nr:K02A2.6-like [Cordylochernes scorpioides]
MLNHSDGDGSTRLPDISGIALVARDGIDSTTRTERTHMKGRSVHAYWTAPIVQVLKKDGSVSICGDFRCTANKAIELDRYPIPSIDEIFSKLSTSTVLSTLYLSQAYLRVMLAEEAKAVVDINTTKRLFSYKRLPYDVAVAPNKFQRIMEGLFADLPGVACYIDDILIAGKDFEDHEQKLDLVFR